jgi:hydrogenase maturation protein HypF
MPKRKKLWVKGIVQGVGFRPFVYRLAHSLRLKGFVRNTTDGVEIEVEGDAASIDRFIERMLASNPPAARIDKIVLDAAPKKAYREFSIKESTTSTGFTQISPDIATCADCLKEMNDPHDRRYKFPFINCTNCGPRYSIIVETPYDRARTSMHEFTMCFDCEKEFQEISDRRFHAQPDCCLVCGPTYSLYTICGKKIETDKPILRTVESLKRGDIVAIKGVGGFHISCDALNRDTITRLRRLKNRPTKPFAIMANKHDLQRITYINADEKEVIESPIAPIMLLRKRGKTICEEVAPNNPYLGVMIPYAPIHHLLLAEIPYFVMTSANIQDEPIVKNAEEVERKLSRLVSLYLDHNRNIENRCDDSVGYHLSNRGFSIIRRSRGYVPIPIDLPIVVKPTLAVGPYLKNTFTLANSEDAYVSPHIGDLDNLETLQFYDEMVTKYKRWFRIDPQLIIHDLHPDYLSTKIAQTMSGQKIGIQHHIAHFVSCLGENAILTDTIGIIFDGTGYGLDGKIWGGEFLIGNITDQIRVAHLQYLPLPGGESSIRKPYRIAIAYAHKLLHDDMHLTTASETKIIKTMIDENRNLVYTSSIGRLFDCISAMLHVTREITYEAEAAINLEYIAAHSVTTHYPYRIHESEPLTVEIADTLAAIVKDTRSGISNNTISAKFHNTLSAFSLDVANRLRQRYGIERVCFSGGVFQNRYLLNLMIRHFEADGFEVSTHRRLPNNDGCISYGQAIAGNTKKVISRNR